MEATITRRPSLYDAEQAAGVQLSSDPSFAWCMSLTNAQVIQRQMLARAGVQSVVILPSQHAGCSIIAALVNDSEWFVS